MIAQWMFAASVFALLAGGAALAAERVQRARGRATRGVWAFALAAAVLWPLLVPMARTVLFAPAQVVGTVVMAPGVSGVPFESAEPSVPWWSVASRGVFELRDVAFAMAARLVEPFGLTLGASLLLLWGVASLLLGVQLVRSMRRVRAITASATPMRVDGTPVLLSAAFGPATVGWRAPQVVVPSWVLSLEAPLRALVLQHEREHCRAGDPRVVAAAAFAVALVPWNAGVWWIARRLRLAIELDCDARTLAAARGSAGDALRDARATYGKLLLFMTHHQSALASPLRLASSLASSRSHLHTRIMAMQQLVDVTTSRVARRQRVLFGAVAVAAIVAACSTDIPGSVTPPAGSTESRIESPIEVVAAPSVESIPMPNGMLPEEPKPYFEFQVERPAAMMGAISLRYPPMLRTAQVEGRVLASFVVDANGRVDLSTFKVLRSDHELFANAVRQALETAQYQAAEVGGRKVAQVVQQPFVFALDRSSQALRGTGTGSAVVLSHAWDGVTPRWRGAPARPINADSIAAMTAARTASADTYFEFQVDEPATMQGRANLRYAIELRNAGIEGTVLAQFVLGTDGRIDPSTFKVLTTDHEGFVESVREALPRMRYTAARKDGRAVRQLVQQPFVFQLAK
jgi:TonB family protein